jgi:hypothetical protein
MTRKADLRAMQRLLVYAYAQSHILNLPHVERLLGAAALALDDVLGRGRARSSTAPRRQRSLGLHAGDGALRKGNAPKA